MPAVRLGAAVAAIAIWMLLPAAADASVPANGRAWELVTAASPVSAKFGGNVPANASGDGLIYETFGAMPGAVYGGILSFNLAARGPSGWTSTPVGFTLPSLEIGDVAFNALLPVLPIGPAADTRFPSLWLSATALSPEYLAPEHLALYRRNADGTFFRIAEVGEGLVALYGDFVAQSTNLEHVVLATKEHLLPSDAGRSEGTSIYDSVGTSLRQVDVATDGTLLSACGSSASHANGVSADGERIFFTNPAAGSCGTSKVYLREGGSETIEASASQCTRPDCNAPQDVTFAGATPDGARVFMTTAQQLTNADTDDLIDLYRYDVESGALTLLTTSPAATGSVGQRVFTSSDGSYVYFYATGSLVPGDAADVGEPHEYLYLSDPTGLHLVARAEAESGKRFEEHVEEGLQLGDDGRVALFMSKAGNEAGDTDQSRDVYLYEADSDTLTRVSKGTTGGNGAYPATLISVIEQEFVYAKPYVYRGLSEDGKDAFFTTQEQLLPEDVNSVADVYEWRAGQLGLVSSGTGDGGAIFGGVSADGSTVFFQTPETLLPADRDGGDSDLYAARVGGGFAEPAPSAPPCAAPCSPSASAPRVTRPTPASVTQHRARPKGKIRLLKVLGAAAGKGETERPTLVVAAPNPGRLSVVGTLPGGGGRSVARGSAGVDRPGRVRIPLRLSAGVDRALARGGSVEVRLVIREGDLRLVRTVELRLPVAR